MNARSDFENGRRPARFGRSCLTTFPPGVRTSRPTCGTHTVPPFAIAEYASASCSGVTSVSPWPIDMLMKSPGSHGQGLPGPRHGNAVGFCLWIWAFHRGSGTRPPYSDGRSTPVSRPNPNERRSSCSHILRPL